MKIPASILAAMALIAGCSPADSNTFQTSAKYPICATVPGKLLDVPSVEKGPDFEYVRFASNDLSGTIYVGGFPDYPGFSPDHKFYESAGHVTFLGMTSHRGRHKELFRFGLGGDPAIHVLFSFPARVTSPVGGQPIGVLHKCGRSGT